MWSLGWKTVFVVGLCLANAELDKVKRSADAKSRGWSSDKNGNNWQWQESSKTRKSGATSESWHQTEDKKSEGGTDEDWWQDDANQAGDKDKGGHDSATGNKQVGVVKSWFESSSSGSSSSSSSGGGGGGSGSSSGGGGSWNKDDKNDGWKEEGNDGWDTDDKSGSDKDDKSWDGGDRSESGTDWKPSEEAEEMEKVKAAGEKMKENKHRTEDRAGNRMVEMEAVKKEVKRKSLRREAVRSGKTTKAEVASLGIRCPSTITMAKIGRLREVVVVRKEADKLGSKTKAREAAGVKDENEKTEDGGRGIQTEMTVRSKDSPAKVGRVGNKEIRMEMEEVGNKI
ncbi:protein RNA-directed DNA methylation 3-like, partial [Centruroides sculpturatus]|uniref:protein RNA-directed DNA methylation 3-like n=1 Tax=Centruroides sculpturatus TaxID=218467 RepID=UPI000C6E438D